MATSKTPPLSEFIDLGQRRAESRALHGFPALQGNVTVAVYDTTGGYQTLTVRISDDLAAKHGLIEGAKMACHIHPDQQFIALTPGKGRGAALFRPKGSRSLVYQTTLKEGTLEPQPAAKASMQKVEDAFVIALA